MVLKKEETSLILNALIYKLSKLKSDKDTKDFYNYIYHKVLSNEELTLFEYSKVRETLINYGKVKNIFENQVKIKILSNKLADYIITEFETKKNYKK